MTVRTRRSVSGAVSGRSRTNASSPWVAYNLPGNFTNTETVNSQNNSRLPGGRWSGGGSFRVDRRTKVFRNIEAFQYSSSFGNHLNEGTIRLYEPQSAVTSISLPAAPSNAELDVLGTQAIARTEPLNPATDLATYLGEMRMEGIPSLPGTHALEHTRAAKAAGSEYLNVEFGWLPFIRGIRDFAKTVEDADKIIRKHQNLANRVIQRRYQWPVVELTRADACSFSAEPFGSFTGGGQWQHSWNRQWFEAEYQFYLPTGQSLNDRLGRYRSYARKLYGIDLSPEVLWNLSPWSWAADWFSDVGDVMHNISALGSDGLVMRHAFVMSHTGREIQRTGERQGVRQTTYQVDEVKIRRPGTPFGFGVSFSGLSRKQIAITAALGLSRW